jgi:pimeloyl-ACP methyl ester carboxylesterase
VEKSIVILFLPGAGASADFWSPVVDRLPEAWQTRRLSWPGLGDEPPHPEVEAFDDLVRLVLNQVGEQVDIVAQSMGGLVALRVALAAGGRVRRLVLTATSGGLDVEALGASDWRDAYRRDFPQAAGWITTAREDLTPALAQMTAPTLLLWGDRDPISPLAIGQRLQALLPQATLRVIEGGGHDFAQTHAAQTARWIEAHLA